MPSPTGQPTASATATAPTAPAELAAFTPTDPGSDVPPCVADGFDYLTTNDSEGRTLATVGLEPTQGDGRAGVVLAHQSNGGPCMWENYARTLADRGYRVIAPAVTLTDEPLGSILAAAASLQAAGSEQVVLIGASMGGTYVIGAAPWLPSAPAGVISLSAPDAYRGVDASDAISRVTAPVLLAVGDQDGGFLGSLEKLGEAAPPGTQTVVVAGTSDHGVRLVENQSEVADAVAAFLTEHAPVG